MDSISSPAAANNNDLKEILNPKEVRRGIQIFNKEKPKDYKKLIKSLGKEKHKYQIFLPKKNGGVENLAHEVGHIENSKSKGIRKLINNKANSTDTRNQFNTDLNSLMNFGNHGKSGIKTATKDYVKSLLINQEEKNASNRGLKIMKNLGASKKELEQAKEHMDKGLETYRSAGKANLFTTLKNTVQIPSRKSESIMVNSEIARREKRKEIARLNKKKE